MASMKSSAFQFLLRGRSPLLRCQQRRWAQVHDVRFLATHHDPKHVQDKYRSKLDQKAQQEGFESLESMQNHYKDKIQDLRRKAQTPLTPEPETPSFPSSAPPPPPQRISPEAEAIASSKGTGIRPLSSYLDVEKIAALPPKEIEALWRLRNANSSSICAVVPVDTYHRIISAARQNPQFVLPLPRTKTEEVPAEETTNGETKTTTTAGAEIHFLQWAFHPPASDASPVNPDNAHTSTIIFTNLEAYKLHGSFAQPHTVITHHLDLADEKGLVLMHGQVTPNSGVSLSEASFLVSSVQRFYDFGGQASGRKGELLRMFTEGDTQGFKIEELLEEAEKLE